MRASEKLGKINATAVAKVTGFTRTHVARVVRGLNHTTLDGAAVIARAAGVTLDELQAHIEHCRAERDAEIKRKAAAKKVSKLAPPPSRKPTTGSAAKARPSVPSPPKRARA